jgi:carbon storage regulator
MLVISRKFKERVFIGDDICITIVALDKGKVRLGIEAPKNIPIYREELATKQKKEESPDKADPNR